MGKTLFKFSALVTAIAVCLGWTFVLVHLADDSHSHIQKSHIHSSHHHGHHHHSHDSDHSHNKSDHPETDHQVENLSVQNRILPLISVIVVEEEVTEDQELTLVSIDLADTISEPPELMIRDVLPSRAPPSLS